jgi:FKBP-type peptidyl-prolyl cis-trans isomerase SlpA
MTERVRADSLITLHYRIATAEDTELISTFAGNPATLKLGGGELAPTLERCLIDLPTGERHVFLLSPEQAFGAHNASLIERRPRAEIPPEIELTASALIEFRAPDGSVYTGFVRELTRDDVLIDFNHPLAGRRVRFEVEVIGIL